MIVVRLGRIGFPKGWVCWNYEPMNDNEYASIQIYVIGSGPFHKPNENQTNHTSSTHILHHIKSHSYFS